MHIFLYEWITGGGLVEERGALTGSLRTEGLAMVQALAADLASIPGARVTILADFRLPQLVARGCEIVVISSRSEHNEAFSRFASAAEATILIAPEFDGELCRCVDRARDAAARLASPDFPFIGFASSKDWTATHLQAAGVSTPPGKILLEENESLPEDLVYPAVVKPYDGAGSQDIYVVSNWRDTPPAYAGIRRIETYMPGMAASVAFLCGGPQPVPLLPCSQRLSTDGRLRYLGGQTPLPVGLAERAVSLGQRAACRAAADGRLCGDRPRAGRFA